MPKQDSSWYSRFMLLRNKQTLLVYCLLFVLGVLCISLANISSFAESKDLLINVGATLICTCAVTAILVHFLGDPVNIATERIQASLTELNSKFEIVGYSMKTGIKSMYCNRNELSNSIWLERLLSNPTYIDYLNASGLKIFGNKAHAQLILNNIKRGANVRILFPNPMSTHITTISANEGVDSFSEQIVLAIRQLRRFARDGNVDRKRLLEAIRLYDYTIQCTFSRFDDEIIASHYLYGWAGENAPTFVVAKAKDGLYEKYLEHFDSLWNLRSSSSTVALEKLLSEEGS